MLRVLALLAALLTAPLANLAFHAPHAAPPQPNASTTMPPAPDPSRALVIDGTAMPGRVGWFLVPVTADADTTVRVDVRTRIAYEGAGPVASAIIAAFDGRPALVLGGTAGSSSRVAEANDHGTRVVCCDPPQASGVPGAGATYSGGGGLQGLEGLVGPTHPLWVGFAAVGWGDGSKLRITITPVASTLHAGAAHHGTTAEAIDLVDEAHGAGLNARLGGNTLAGSPGTARVERTPTGTALVSVMATSHGAAGAALTVRLPNGSPLAGRDVHDGYVGLQAAKQGPIAIELGDVREPQPALQANARDYSYVSALALYADVDVPLDGFAMYAGSFNDDW